MRKKLISIHNKRSYKDFPLDFGGDTIDILPVSVGSYEKKVLKISTLSNSDYHNNTQGPTFNLLLSTFSSYIIIWQTKIPVFVVASSYSS